MGNDNKRLQHLQERAFDSVRRLRELDLTTLEAEVLIRLMDGKRTAAELVDDIYGQRRGEVGYEASRKRTQRALKNLERRGFVSTRILGRDRPYRMTKHGIAVLASIALEEVIPNTISLAHIGVFTITILLGVALLVYSQVISIQVRLVIILLFASFFTFFGFSLSLLLFLIGRVS